MKGVPLAAGGVLAGLEAGVAEAKLQIYAFIHLSGGYLESSDRNPVSSPTHSPGMSHCIQPEKAQLPQAATENVLYLESSEEQKLSPAGGQWWPTRSNA